ncbi:S46 family peptidase [Chromatiaceae bacterium AAb-1]|nr:S46 family peptidase [Chromatiaceae bacterium AAb-1]
MTATLLGGVLAFSAPSFADEGMWQPHQLPLLPPVIKQLGAATPPAGISKLLTTSANAVVSFGDDCSGAFVSDRGLILTSYSCAYSNIQHNTTSDHNLLVQGLLAKYTADELPTVPDTRVFVTEQITDVTKQITRQLNNIPGEKVSTVSGRERFDTLDRLYKELVAGCEQDGHYRCTVYRFHDGLEYYLVKQLEIRDIRLVYAPALSIARFGGDADNGRWPRHAGNFAFYRAYVGPDGKPADYAPDNKPFVPPSVLPVSVKGTNEGDFVMAMGFPQQTHRYRSASEFQNQFTHIYPASERYQQEMIAIIKRLSAESPDIRRKYESQLSSLTDSARKTARLLAGYRDGKAQQRKDLAEQRVINWINADRSRWQKYEPAMQQLDELITQQQQYQQRDLILSYFNSAQLPAMAKQLYRLAQERQKPDAERETGFQQRDMARFRDVQQRLSRKIDSQVDLELALNFLRHYARLPQEQRLPELDRFFSISDGFNLEIVRHKLQAMYRKTQLQNEAERLAWMERTPQDFAQSDDPMIAYAVALHHSDMLLEQQRKTLEGQLAAVRPLLMQIIKAFNQARKKPVYADANGTLRITYGTVQGYQPKDAVWYQPVTTATGLLSKISATPPFDAPALQTETLRRAEFGRYLYPGLKSLPVNFLSTVDTTEGGYGSPTLNRKGELVGLLFDRVSESTIGDWDYDESLNRAIHIDSRYLLWQLEQVDGAFNLLSEMDIVY